MLNVTPLFWFLALAFLVSAYSFWKRLREDYAEELIFGLTLRGGFFALIFARLFFVLCNLNLFEFSVAAWVTAHVGADFNLGGAFVGVVWAVVWQMKKRKKHPWEVLDALSLAVLYFLVLGGVGSFLTNGIYSDLFFSVIGLVGLGFFPFLKKNYRSFSWYKSGKTGFLFALYSVYVFFFLLVLAFFKPDNLYLNRLISLFLVLASLWILYTRSERNLREDARSIFKFKRREI